MDVVVSISYYNKWETFLQLPNILEMSCLGQNRPLYQKVSFVTSKQQVSFFIKHDIIQFLFCIHWMPRIQCILGQAFMCTQISLRFCIQRQNFRTKFPHLYDLGMHFVYTLNTAYLPIKGIQKKGTSGFERFLYLKYLYAWG